MWGCLTYPGERLANEIEFTYVLMFVKADLKSYIKTFGRHISFDRFSTATAVNIPVEKVKVSCFLIKYLVCVDF